MTTLQAIILGFVQGLTEFLPISSSAHLVLIPYFLNWSLPAKEMFIFNVLVQVGTLVAVLIYFRKDVLYIVISFLKQLIRRKPFAAFEARLGWLVIVATIPAGVIGFLLRDIVEETFTSPTFAGIALLVTAVLMIIAELVSFKIGETQDINLLDAIIMGVMQTLAIFPGISRSGATISGGMMRHLRRASAAKFSFLMAIPIMLAAGGLSIYKMITEVPNLTDFIPLMAIGFVTAVVVGYISIRWLLHFLSNHSLIYFALYCILLGAGTIILTQWIG